MKKLVITLAVMALGASMALAYGPGMGRGFHGGGFGAANQGINNQNFGPGRGGCPGAGYYAGQQQAVEQLSEEEAKAKVKEFMDVNLKGFSVTQTQQFNVPMGNMYQFSASDDNGNTFILRVNPFGYVRGPFPANTYNQ